ncbi:hypothetical protein [Winogradskyella sp. Asnod2-B02-A]|uniref:hypothetical protein n=1 Tax=Winogradskyella sp. Asnod2-B02-A TaxID=3160583 RepID=UPI003868019B
MGNNIEKLPLKKRVIGGIFSGLFFASSLAVFDYFDNHSFSLLKYLFGGLFFGFFMSLSFRHKITKKKD